MLAGLPTTSTLTLRDATALSALPFSYLDDKQEAVGYAIDVCRKIARFLTKRIRPDAPTCERAFWMKRDSCRISPYTQAMSKPSLVVAARIASGLDLTLSQLLRLDEGGSVTIVRADEPPKPAEMAGYLLVPHEKVDKSYNAGFSMYVAAWPLLKDYPGQDFQSGLFGTWMFAQYDGPKPEKASPRASWSCICTRSIPVIISVTGCSTWMRVFISRK